MKSKVVTVVGCGRRENCQQTLTASGAERGNKQWTMQHVSYCFLDKATRDTRLLQTLNHRQEYAIAIRFSRFSPPCGTSNRCSGYCSGYRFRSISIGEYDFSYLAEFTNPYNCV